MNIYGWIGLSGIVFLTLIPLLNKKQRTREEVEKAIVTVAIVLGIIIAVLVFNINYFTAFLFGVLAMILFDHKTYTKKRLTIYGVLSLIAGIAAYALLRDNPNYVIQHLKENPESSSLYVAENGEPVITYQSTVIRPLASTVKILIAVEYAMQVEENKIQKDQTIPLADLNRYYLKNTDGGGHEAWLEAVKQNGGIQNNAVTLHDVAKGMVTYSSNANTDYLINLLGVDAINQRKTVLGLTQHEDVYPIVSALLIPDSMQKDGLSEKELIDALEKLSMEDYRNLAQSISLQMKTGEINASEAKFDSSPAVQRVWSDRLIGASANEYGKLLSLISNDELPANAAETIRDLMEWPMQLNEENHKKYTHIGSKGGSTLFILNNAMYVENLKGDQFEIVILLNDLKFHEHFLLRNNRNSFERKLLNDADFRNEVRDALLN
ncbi:serine hydrolase [Solibacillus sp. FSL W7-1464]|uniref:serine hydrolase n=1 Tax=Solibacillus sp. FSL W7-1464 TaxID=2921706 RepID=UPI0030F61BA9